MNKVSTTLLTLLFCASLSAQSVNLTDGLIGHYALDGDVQDASGNARHAVHFGDPVFITDRFGTANAAIDLDGINDYVKVSSFPIDFDYTTVSFWVKATSSGSINFGAFHIGNSANSTGFGFSIYGNSGATANRGYVGYRDNAWSNGSYPVEATTTPVADNTWHHVVFVYGSTNASTYVDGALQSSTARNSTMNQSGSTELQIGHLINQNPGNYHFDGAVDDLRVYSRALNSSEITALYNNELAPVEEASGGDDEGLLSDGVHVGIGTTDYSTPGFLFFVREGILAERVKVKLRDQWGDYIFAPEYDLISLEDLEKYVKKNSHLPDIPSEAELKDSGIDLGSMDAGIVKNVERLTLHLIEMNKQLELLRTKNEKLEAELQKLKEEKEKN